MKVQRPSSLSFDRPNVTLHNPEDTWLAVDSSLRGLDSEHNLKQGIDHEVEEFGSSIGIRCYVLCAGALIWTRSFEECV